MKQADLAEAMGTTQSAVSAWSTGKTEPGSATLFAMEEALGVAPGFLSRTFDYLPITAVDAPPSIEQAIQLADTIDDDMKKMLLFALQTMEKKHRDMLTLASGTARKGRPAAPPRAKSVPAPHQARFRQ